MGMVSRVIEFRSKEELLDYLKLEYGFEPDLESKKVGAIELGEIELGDILVKAEIECFEKEAVLRLKKLVSLKAFLLSKEAGMDINKLLYDIDSLMNMSEDGLNWSGTLISDDKSLEEFLDAAGIDKTGDNELKDSKRTVKVKKIMGSYDFNSIEEI